MGLIYVEPSRFPHYAMDDDGNVHGGVVPMGGYTPVKVVPLDAIVIDRADLPTQDSILYYEDDGREVEPRIKSGSAHIVIRGASPEYAESTARHYLALAQWLREHPPVDEAAVKRAKIAMLDIGHTEAEAESSARDLVAKGYRLEVKEP